MHDSSDNKPRVSQGTARRASDAPLGWLPLRGPSGRLYGYYDPQTQVIEVKRGGQETERISLGELQKR